MGFRLVFAVSASATAAVLSGVLAPIATPASAATVPTVSDVRVGSFNLSSVSFDKQATGDHRPWLERRPVVVSQILGEKIDVLGLQEANQSKIYTTSVNLGINQYMDLKNAVNLAGGHYALTNENAYNCVKPVSTYKCVYQDQGASQDNRILYNTDTVTMLSQGSVKYNTQTAGKNERYFEWAKFKVKATGKQFFFSNTHLDPYSAATRKGQWDEVIANTNRLRGSLPVVAVGDYNTSKFTDYAATYLPKMKSAGYGDVLNQQYAQNVVKTPRAEKLTRGWINSYNAFGRDIRPYSYEDARNKVGNSIDWIFATNSLRVKEWSVVTNVDLTTLRVKGVIPSDHSLVRATLVL
jgi:endonuclease/exonuclease/phosphatase family metal-dependent hydrolase